MFYLVAWAVVLAYWSQEEPLVLFWALLISALLSLRIILFFQQVQPKKHVDTLKPTADKKHNTNTTSNKDLVIRINPKLMLAP